MKVQPVKLLPVERLRSNPANPKGPLGLKYRRGLREGLQRFGFAGVLVVAENDDETFEVLDGNTRLEELEREGVEKIPCIVYKGMDAAERTRFVLAHDRHRKQFNEDAVLAQLETLASNGDDLKQLSVLAGVDNLQRLLAETSGKATAAVEAVQKQEQPAMATMVLYGPSDAINGIKETLKTIRGKLNVAEKVRKILVDADRYFEWDDERFAAALLSALRECETNEGPEADADDIEDS